MWHIKIFLISPPPLSILMNPLLCSCNLHDPPSPPQVINNDVVPWSFVMFHLLLIFFTSSVSNWETTLLRNLYYYCYNYYYLIFNSLQFFFYIFIRRLVVCRTCVFYEPTNGSPWDRAVFSSVIELRVTQSKGLGFLKSQETNEMNYLSRPLKSMEDWIY